MTIGPKTRKGGLELWAHYLFVTVDTVGGNVCPPEAALPGLGAGRRHGPGFTAVLQTRGSGVDALPDCRVNCAGSRPRTGGGIGRRQCQAIARAAFLTG